MQKREVLLINKYSYSKKWKDSLWVVFLVYRRSYYHHSPAHGANSPRINVCSLQVIINRRSLCSARESSGSRFLSSISPHQMPTSFLCPPHKKMHDTVETFETFRSIVSIVSKVLCKFSYCTFCTFALSHPQSADSADSAERFFRTF